jgi:hypothetical protein
MSAEETSPDHPELTDEEKAALKQRMRTMKLDA